MSYQYESAQKQTKYQQWTPGSAPTVIETFDVNQQAESLKSWHQQYDQISDGEFFGKLTELTLEHVHVFKEETEQALQQACEVSADSFWLGLPVQTALTSRVNGLEVEHNKIICRPGGIAFELTTPEHFEIFGIVISQSDFHAIADRHDIVLPKELFDTPRIQLPFKVLQQAHYLLNHLLKTRDLRPPDHLQYDLICLMLLDIFDQHSLVSTQKSGFKHRKKVVDQVRGYLQDNKDTPISVTELCDLANVSRRTLQYSFMTVLGISPLQYLRLSRLNAVRRALQANHEQRTVGEIASEWGFWHLSQFSCDYKRLFGECPSMTKRIE